MTTPPDDTRHGAPTAAAPAISIVIPSHDRRELLLRAVDSVLRQDRPDFELLIVDDGSTDQSANAVAAIGDERIRVLRQGTRRGANAARNRGLMEARAPLVAFLDSDDVYEPHKLSTVLETFAAQSDLGTLVDSYAIVNPAKPGPPEQLVNRVIPNSEEFLPALFDSTVKARRLRKSTSGMTVRRDIAIRAGLFDERVKRRQDMEFLVRLAKVARCATTDAVLWTKHEQAQSISFTGDGFIAATLLMARSHPEYLSRSAYLPADVVMYLWECIKRRRFRQLGRDLRLLSREFGIGRTTALIGRGLWAWQVDARGQPRLRQRRGDRPTA